MLRRTSVRPVAIRSRTPRCNGDHRRSPSASLATAVFGVAASTGPVILILAPVTNSISITSPLADPTGLGIGTTVAQREDHLRGQSNWTSDTS
jgi:hypothetical protein